MVVRKRPVPTSLRTDETSSAASLPTPTVGTKRLQARLLARVSFTNSTKRGSLDSHTRRQLSSQVVGKTWYYTWKKGRRLVSFLITVPA